MRFRHAVGCLPFLVALAARPDATVVFNEIMYHPPQTNEAAFEWVELRNQLAVDMDLSGWSLDGTVDYLFPEGTVVPGGGYVVVAGSPADLAAAAGITNVLGPFTGRLGNGGATLELRNNNDRLMDEVDYGTDKDWPPGADGAGPSLAKLDEDGPSADPANWRASPRAGGTPGRSNHPVVTVTNLLSAAFDSTWRYASGAADPGADWNTEGFSDSGWNSGAGLFSGGTGGWRPGETQAISTVFSSGVDDSGAALAPGVPDPHYWLTASAYSVPPPPAIRATVMANHPNWLANDTLSRWIGVVSSGSANVPAGVYQFRTGFDLAGFDPATARLYLQVGVDNYLTNVLLNGAVKGIAYSNFNALSSTFVVSNGFASGANTLDFHTLNGGASANPAGFRVRASGTAVKWAPTNTAIAAGPTTWYFRLPFTVSGDPAAAGLTVRAVIDDGAVFYLNGAEALRVNMPAGAVDRFMFASTNVGNASYSGPFTLPTDALLSGTNVLAVEVHQAAGAGTNDVMFGAELSLSLTNGLPPRVPTLAFNELPSVTNQQFWVEILNHGSQSVALTNFLFKRFGLPDREYVIPPQSVPAGGRVLIDRAELGYGADPGDLLALYAPDRSVLVDAAVAKHYPRARWPEATGPWLHPAAPTPGATNDVRLRDDVVINEIMYHPRDPQGPPTNSPEQWVELYNRGTGTVNLARWRLDIDGETAFRFPEGRTLAPDGYLVVAKNAAFLQAKYPGVDIAGDFTNRLNKGGSTVELFDDSDYPTDITINPDVAGNPVDSVRYGDRRPWPSYPDGLGASLELRDPRADNARPEAWAASDDRAKSAWTAFTNRAVAAQEPANSPSLWKELVMGLLDEGEVLIDDVRVVERPSGPSRQLVQNGGFDTGTSAWRIIGNHRWSAAATDPDAAGNPVLKLVSEGYGEHMHNHAETTLAYGAAVTNGLEYEISFRAKWIAGCNRLNARLYFNRLAKVYEIPAPDLVGTPGARNSRYAANIGPTVFGLSHAPAVPVAGQPVTVSAAASDPDGVSTAVLHYAVNDGAWTAVPMTRTDAGGGGAVSLSASVPGQAAGAVVQFHLSAADGLGASAAYPAGGTNSRALFKVSDGSSVMSGVRPVRLVLTPADTAWLHAATNVMSNGRTGCTVILDEKTVAYDAGVHLQGSERGRDVATRVGFTVRLPWDKPYRGALDGFTIDRSGGYAGANPGGDQNEILLKHIINRAGGLPGMYDDLCQFFAPRSSDDGTGLLILAKYGDEFLDSQFKDGGDGELFKLELVYYPTSTVVPGDPQSAKLPQPDSVLGTDIKDLGDDPENYRWTFLKENRTARNHYAPMVALAKAFSQTGTVLDAQMAELMDVDEWMRTVAYYTLIGGNDIYTYGNSHNLVIYFRPEDGRGMAFPWDLDYSFVQAYNAAFPGTGSPNTTKLINRPQNLHAYYAHLYDLCDYTGDNVYLLRWASNYAGRVYQDWSAAVAWLKQRADYVRSQLPVATAFAITNNGGANFAVSNGFLTLSGSAPVTVRDIAFNGVLYPVTWNTVTNWSITIPLTGYVNPISLQTYDLRARPLTNAVDSIVVTNFGVPAPRPVVVNEWMADNAGPGGLPDPADGQFQDWFELYNPNDMAVDLSGFTLTDNPGVPDKWAIPTNTVIAPRGFLLVWADEDLLQNGGGTNGDLHADFKLSNGGESIGLYSPEGVRQNLVTFGPQLQNIGGGLFPDGTTNAVYAMTNWTPRAANLLGEPPPPDLQHVAAPPGGSVSLQSAATPHRLYQGEYQGDLGGTNWMPWSTNRAGGPSVSFEDPSPGPTQRFYRVRLIP